MEREPKITELDKLYIEVKEYRNSNKLKELFDFVKNFPNIAPYNAMLLQIQKPGSLYVASPREWRERFKRDIKPGARPLIILQPFGPVAFVFELNDTYGDKPFPQELLKPFRVNGDVNEGDLNRLIENIKCDGVLYSESDHGTGSAGYIEKNKREFNQEILNSKNVICVKSIFEMIVNKNLGVSERFATMLHELGHMYCGHLGSPYTNWWHDRRRLGKNSEEFEAESVCWLVCERMGLKNPSAEYLSGYLENNKEIPNISIDAIFKAVAIIESNIKTKRNPRKEIIIESAKRDNQ